MALSIDRITTSVKTVLPERPNAVSASTPAANGWPAIDETGSTYRSERFISR